IITGGEPTECLDLILEETKKKKDVFFALTTNAEHLSRDMLENIKRAGNMMLVISLDGIGSVHNQSRKEGSFDRILNSITLIKEYQIPFGFNTVANAFNLKQILNMDLGYFIHSIGGCSWEILRYYPIGSHADNFKMLMLNESEHMLLKAYREKLAQQNPFDFVFTSPENNIQKCNKSIHINPRGYFSYCPFSAWALGKIEVSDSAEMVARKILLKENAWSDLTQLTSGFCPLQDNLNKYIEFHELNGEVFLEATGILKRDFNV
ncbi:MAG: radical SAM protein, partial [Bacteroidales bacterium]|nr:radical SAM protein [Bacteroidales bacterium]